ncbi:MAG: DinB family protein [Ktedonobacteraceae bacterium]|nr:DinB family protein [Ktedonobacteraceae bacterium]
MNATRAQLITTLQQTQSTLTRLTSTLPDSALDFRPSPDEWSIREILAHLVDDDMFVMRTRLERLLREDNPSLVPHDEKEWHSQRNTSRDKIDELLSDFAVQRAASLGIFAFLREEDWTRTGYHPEYGNFTAQEWLAHWAKHDLTHIRQIEATLDAYNRQASESQ